MKTRFDPMLREEIDNLKKDLPVDLENMKEIMEYKQFELGFRYNIYKNKYIKKETYKLVEELSDIVNLDYLD